QDTAQKLNIQSLPTLLLFKDGQLVDKSNLARYS
ncbi:thioredoxin family protein, partial [Leptospira haakeii]